MCEAGESPVGKGCTETRNSVGRGALGQKERELEAEGVGDGCLWLRTGGH